MQVAGNTLMCDARIIRPNTLRYAEHFSRGSCNPSCTYYLVHSTSSTLYSTRTTLSLLGGWHALAKHYHSRDPLRGGDNFIGAGLMLRRAGSPVPVVYRDLVFVQVAGVGLGLSISLFLRLLHPSLIIPWAAVLGCYRDERWFNHSVIVDVVQPRIRLFFSGASGEQILRVYSEYCAKERLLPAPNKPPPMTPGWLRHKFFDLAGQ